MTTVKWQHVGIAAIASVAFWTAWIVNADYFRKAAQPDFSFGEVEMLRVLASINQTNGWRFSHAGSDHQLQVTLRQAPGTDVLRNEASLGRPFVSRAFACGSRTFRQTASACYDITTVPIEGTLVLRRWSGSEWSIVLNAAPAKGILEARGRRLGIMALRLRTDGVYLELNSVDAQHFSFNVQLSDGDPVGTRP